MTQFHPTIYTYFFHGIATIFYIMKCCAGLLSKSLWTEKQKWKKRYQFPNFAIGGLCCALFCSFLFSEQEIDIVYTWVNGHDSSWIQQRNQWAMQEGKSLLGSDAYDSSRFRDNQELKYSLRSLLKYVPFVRKIYIVTCGQKPSWLIDHPKIEVINHTTFFKNDAYLPTFNSHAIESNLHRIPGLAEQYVYMNDDFFYGRPICYDDFFSMNGNKIKIYFSRKQRLKAKKPTLKDSGYEAANKNTACLLQKLYGKKIRYTHTHTPYPQIKSLIKKIEAQFPLIFDTNSSHRFRVISDYTVTNGLIPYIAYYMDRAEVGNASHETINYGKNFKSDKKKLSAVLEQNIAFFCLNDSPNMNDQRSLHLIIRFLQLLYPEPAPWEKVEEDDIEIDQISDILQDIPQNIPQKKKLSLFKRIAKKIEK